MIVGRNEEISRLERVFKSNEAEFVVLYGRRRVGKTYLIREFFANKNCIYFQSTGLQKGALAKQLGHFADSLSGVFTQGMPIKTPASWEEAFKTLTQAIENDKSDKKAVLFLDELPWMATRKSGLLEALDYYWNRFWSANPKIILIVCGSSASWLIRNIIYNKGGLHNRCTLEIKLEPFNLAETNTYLTYGGIKLNKNHILEIYMAFGGIPYYLKYVEPGLTASENIQKMLFDKKAPLKDEFKKLFQSLFKHSSAYIELVQIIAQKKEGIPRSVIASSSKLTQGGGRLTDRLQKLIHTNFIESYVPFEKERGEYYKVIDEFCLFYIHWVSSKVKKYAHDHWLKQIEKPIYHVWAGYAFEAVCYKHIQQIIKVLNIKTAETISTWRLSATKEKEDGAQIDLLIDRSDDAITICEIKYTELPFAINKECAANLNKKIKVFKKMTKTTKQIFLAMISAHGLKPTLYSEEMVDGIVTMEDLFKPED